MITRRKHNTRRCLAVVIVLFFLAVFAPLAPAAELPLVRIAYGAFNEKIVALWIGVEQGFFRRHGVNVELITIRTGGQTVAALASGDVQIAFTIPGSVLNAFVGGIDVTFFGGIGNRALHWQRAAPTSSRIRR